jgi:hypothetical protein
MSYDAIDRAISVLGIDPLVKSHKCFFEEGDVRIDINPVRGTFMGLPASWIVLSVIHCCICLLVAHENTFYIKGDDLIAYWTESQWNSYLALMVRAGFKINLKKSFVSDCRGLFCEKAYKLSFRESSGSLSTYDLVDMNLLSLRFISKRGDDSLLPWASKVLRFGKVSHLMTNNGRKTISRILRNQIPISYLSLSLGDSLPLQLGGLGLLNPKLLNTKIKNRPLRVYQSILNGINRPISDSEIRWTSDALEAAREDLQLESYRLISFKVEGRHIVSKKHFASMFGQRTEHMLMEGHSSSPRKNLTKLFRSLKKLHRSTGEFSSDSNVSLADCYRLPSTLGVDMTEMPVKDISYPPYKVKAFGYGRISQKPRMAAGEIEDFLKLTFVM